MGLFDKLFPKKTDKVNAASLFKSLTAYQPVFTNWDGALYESELVRSAIDARARHAAKLKVEINGSAQPTFKRKLEKKPNEWQTWYQFMYRASTILDCVNNCFILPTYDENMNVNGYFPALPSRCEIVEYKDKMWLRYTFSNGDIGAVEYGKTGLLTKFQYKDDFFGSSNHALDETLDVIHRQNEGIEEAIKMSNTYQFMAKLTNFSSDEDLEEERKKFTQNNLLQNEDAKGLLLFPNIYSEIKQIESKPFNLDADQMELIRTNVFNYYGVNDDVLQNKAYGDKWTAFYEGAIEPFAIQFSEVMTKTIYSEKEQASGNEILATSNRLQYLSNTEKLAVSKDLSDRGIINRNEARDIWNLGPIPDGDVFTIRGEYKNADEVNEVGDSNKGTDDNKTTENNADAEGGKDE